MKILTLNCGSSSVKYGLWDMPDGDPLAQGLVERIALAGGVVNHNEPGREAVRVERDVPTHADAIALVFDTLTGGDAPLIADMADLDAVAHRVVHGGERYTHSVLIDDDVIAAIEDNVVLAPLHNPNNLIGIERARAIVPDRPHTASWDTAFSAAYMPPRASTYAIPFELYEKYGIRRFGYQGLSHLYVTRRAAALLGREPAEVNIISFHIGNGSTVTAVRRGVPVDQSLGFSTGGEGLVMGTRSGDLDPIVPLHLMRHAGLSVEEVEDVIYRRSGVLGLSGKFVDRRDVIAAAEAGDERAALALDVETYRIKKYLGAYAAAMGGIDAVVFTAGVGENSPLHRERSCDGLGFLGIRLDPERNAAAVGRSAERDIAADDSPVRVFVIPTDEELVMAEDAAAIVEGSYEEPSRFRYSFESPGFVPSYARGG